MSNLIRSGSSVLFAKSSVISTYSLYLTSTKFSKKVSTCSVNFTTRSLLTKTPLTKPFLYRTAIMSDANTVDDNK